MPTYRNDTDKTISYASKGKLYSFPPHKEYAAKFWLPYKELGLTLINMDFPPIPEKIFISGQFKFSEGVERKFNIEHCEKYSLLISMKTGKLKLYTGNSRGGIEISTDYFTRLEWAFAPYIRIVGLENGTIANIRAENESVDS